MSIEYALVAAAFLLLVSIITSKISSRLGVPALLLFLVVGMLAGSEGLGGIYFDDPWLAQFLGVAALAFILFSGGLDTQVEDIRPVLRQGFVLATAGVFLTATLVAVVVHMVLDFSLKESVLFGAIISSTDAAAVFAVLRGKNVGLKGPLKPLLELESGSNDPMAIFLTVGMITLIQEPDKSVFSLIPMFVQQMAIGALFGYLIGHGITELINRLRLEYDGLYSVVTIAAVMLAYGATAALGGNGFLAVYLAGVVSGNQTFIHKRSIKNFHEGLAWLMQIVMFLTLGLLVFPSELGPVVSKGLLVSLFLMVIARPLAVFVTLSWTRLDWRQKVFISWVGLRGAAPIILATFPLVAGLAQAESIFNLVFFIVLTSVLVQGTSLARVARGLGVDEPAPPRRAYPIELIPGAGVKNDLVEIVIPGHSPVVGLRLVDIQLPQDTLVVLIGRDDDLVIPSGATVLEAGDTVLVLAEKNSLPQVRATLSGPEAPAET
jgi:potassium/hydrogen antiporter